MIVRKNKCEDDDRRIKRKNILLFSNASVRSDAEARDKHLFDDEKLFWLVCYVL